jgi:uncharacterized protein (DUF1697 family)
MKYVAFLRAINVGGHAIIWCNLLQWRTYCLLIDFPYNE